MATYGGGYLRAVDRLRERGQFAAGARYRPAERGGCSRFPRRDALAALFTIPVGKPRFGIHWRRLGSGTRVGDAKGDRGSPAAVFYPHRGGHPLESPSAVF